jgi:hypothetical protein
MNTPTNNSNVILFTSNYDELSTYYELEKHGLKKSEAEYVRAHF